MTIYHEKSMFLSKNGFINKSRAAIHGEAPSFFSQIFKFRSDESEAYSSSRSLGISLIFLAGTPPTVIRHIMRHNGTGRNDDIVSDRDAWNDDDTSPDPYIIPDRHWFCNAKTFSSA